MGSILKVDCEFYDEKSERRGRTKIQWLYATLASTTLLTYGLQAGWMSPMSKILQSDQSPTGAPLTDSEMSWVGSVLAATATFAVGIYAHVADAYGRKFGIIAISVPQALCWIFKIFATSPTMLIIARIFGGIASGGCFNLVPMYVKEISEDHIRGAMVSMTLLMQNFGLMAIYAMGSYMGYYTVLYVVLVIPVFTTIIMIFAPESPAYLVKRGKFEQAEATTALLRGLGIDDKIVQSEVQFMRNEEMHYSSLPRITFLNIFRNKAWRRGFILVMAIITAQAFNGCFYILTYAWSIMSASGVTGSPELQSLIVPALMIFGSLVSMVCVEKLGRKNLLVATYALTAIAFVVLASAQLIQAHGGSTPGWVPVLAIAASVWAYAAGVVPMVYVIMSEMFNFQVRAKLIGCIVTYAWFTSSSQLIVATPIINAFGIYTLFFMFAGINLIGMIVALTLPETKGKTVEQIENMLDGSGKK